jgi:hypothetical protein
MAKTKISEFSSTPANNTDIDSINIAEGCAPSGINDAIRELMAQLKDFQTGAAGDSFNGPVGTTTAAAGAFTTLAASGIASFAAGSASAPALTRTGDTNTGIFFPAADTIAFAEGGVEAMRLDSNGNVGVGTTSPGTKLDVAGNLRFSAANPVIELNNGGAQIYSTVANTLQFASGGGIGTPTERMRIDSSGNVGIGTSSPSTKLQVTIAPASGADNGMRVTDGTRIIQTNITGSAYSYIGIGGSETMLYSTGNPLNIVSDGQPIKFIAGNAERARINSSGQLLVNNTAGAGFAARVVSVGPVNGDAFAGEVPSGSTGGGTCYVGKISNTQAYLAYWLYGSSNVGTISSNGSTTAYNTTSDYRLKEQVQPMTGALARVAALKPCTYKWNADGSAGEGFIAHELAEVVPDAVTGEKDAVNEDGSIKPQGIDTSFLVATLTAAIQEQQALIQTLTARVTALEGT